jgi:hypothetical protein
MALPDIMGEPHPTPPSQDVMGEPHPTPPSQDVMGEPHPTPPSQDVMGEPDHSRRCRQPCWPELTSAAWLDTDLRARRTAVTGPRWERP